MINDFDKIINLYKGMSKILVRRCSYKAVRRPCLLKNDKIKSPKLESQNKQNINLIKYIKEKILATGPITVAGYMKEVLTHPNVGYYMNHDVFGKEGDFITSPEISPIFGELVGVWLLSEWRKIGSPTPFQIVELGPGRGKLARDIIKVITKILKDTKFSLHMVEISPTLSKIQAQQLCFEHVLLNDDNLRHYQTGNTLSGIEVFWHKQLEDVPDGFSLVVANEFFDALPIHKLQLDKDGLWKEILIDIDLNTDELRFVISKSQTPISKLYKAMKNEKRECLEYSVETERIVGLLAERFERDGGFGLIMDYGHFGEKSDTFRAFRKHTLYDPLKDPGTADLTADVDFAHIKRVAEERDQVICFGPVEQRFFLEQMGGELRLKKLMQHALPEDRNILKEGYKWLTDPKQMGSRFKMLSMFPAVLRDHLAKFKVNGFN